MLILLIPFAIAILSQIYRHFFLCFPFLLNGCDGQKQCATTTKLKPNQEYNSLQGNKTSQRREICRQYWPLLTNDEILSLCTYSPRPYIFFELKERQKEREIEPYNYNYSVVRPLNCQYHSQLLVELRSVLVFCYQQAIASFPYDPYMRTIAVSAKRRNAIYG